MRRKGGCIAVQYKGPQNQWGPYAYHVTKHRSKQSWNYLGKITLETALWVGNTFDTTELDGPGGMALV